MKKKPLDVLMLPVGQMAANCYILSSKSGEAIIVDPGDDGQYIIGEVLKRNLTPTKIVATHGHFDHILAAAECAITFNIPFFVHKEDEPLVGRMSESAKHFLGAHVTDPPPLIAGHLKDKDTLIIDEQKIDVVHVPGHTPGSIALYSKAHKWILVGDLLFAGGGVGRTDFSYSDTNTLQKSIQKVLHLPQDTLVYSGHGRSWTLGAWQEQETEMI